jgi:hypothetical protein
VRQSNHVRLVPMVRRAHAVPHDFGERRPRAEDLLDRERPDGKDEARQQDGDLALEEGTATSDLVMVWLTVSPAL